MLALGKEHQMTCQSNDGNFTDAGTADVPTSNKTLDSFVTVSRRFCEQCEQSEHYTLVQFTKISLTALSEIYSRFVALELAPLYLVSEIDTDPAYERSRIIHRILGDKFGNLDVYWECFDPYELAEPVMYTISDCMADIYGDLKAGLLAYDSDAPNRIELAIDAWWGLHFHWGLHLVNAVKVLHCTLMLLNEAEKDTSSEASASEDNM